MLGVVIAVMQLESHVLQPLLLGRAVKLHPLAVVLVDRDRPAGGRHRGRAARRAAAGGAELGHPLAASEADEHVDPEDVHTSEPEETGPDEPGLDRQADLT